MAAEVHAPPLREFPIAPKPQPGSMAGSSPYVANAKVQEAIGFPGLRVYLDACVHCGACTDKCHFYIGTADPKNMPVARQELMRGVYRRHFTLAGKLFPKLVGARELTRELLDDWYKYFNQC